MSDAITIKRSQGQTINKAGKYIYLSLYFHMEISQLYREKSGKHF